MTSLFGFGQNRRIWTETSVSTIAAFAPMAAGIITAPITARAIGPVGRGFVATGLTWTSLLALLFCLSLGQVAVSIASRRDREHAFSEFVGTMGGIALGGTALTWIVLSTLWLSTGGALFGQTPGWVIATIALNAPFFLWNYFAVGLIQIKGLVRHLAILSAIATGTGLIITITLVGVLKLGLVGVLISIGVGNAILAVSQAWLVLSRCDSGPLWNRALSAELIRNGIRLHPNALGIFVIAHSDILMLSRYTSAEEVGWYQLAVVLVGPLMLVPQSMSSSLYSLVAREGPDGAWSSQKKLIRQITALTVIGVVAGIILAGPVVLLVGGAAFTPAVPMLQILFLAAIPKAIPTMISPQFVARGMFARVSLFAIGGGILNVALNLWAIPRAGGVGAAWTTVVAYGFMLGASLINTRAFRARPADANPPAPLAEPEGG